MEARLLLSDRFLENLKEQFTFPLLAWFDNFGRKTLPWKCPQTPYRIWVSEIMLQQTQVKTVIPYFQHFIQYFPDVWHLAESKEDQVLSCWSGLGYYHRVHNLIKTAKIICNHYQGALPSEISELLLLPGIGNSTAAAIASQAFNKPTPIMDGNVKRILCRYFMVEGNPEIKFIKDKLWQLAQYCMQTTRCADYTQAIMDLGALCCTIKKPQCESCPLQKTCKAKQHGKVENYPHKKEKKNLPIKKETFLLFHTKDKLIYLEKRPNEGLWPGLWCLPALQPIDLSTLPIFIKNIYNLPTLSISELINIKHSFSHFHLFMNVITILTSEPKNTDLHGKWVNLAELPQLGLASPTLNIIRHFQANSK